MLGIQQWQTVSSCFLTFLRTTVRFRIQDFHNSARNKTSPSCAFFALLCIPRQGGGGMRIPANHALCVCRSSYFFTTSQNDRPFRPETTRPAIRALSSFSSLRGEKSFHSASHLHTHTYTYPSLSCIRSGRSQPLRIVLAENSLRCTLPID
jgi:hypothetical protein